MEFSKVHGTSAVDSDQIRAAFAPPELAQDVPPETAGEPIPDEVTAAPPVAEIAPAEQVEQAPEPIEPLAPVAEVAPVAPAPAPPPGISAAEQQNRDHHAALSGLGIKRDRTAHIRKGGWK